LPHVALENDFALKGGTAINLFVRDLPRLSVDIDLAYLPVADRQQSLAAIEEALIRISGRITKAIPRAIITERRPGAEAALTGLNVRQDKAQIKVEVTPVIRGAVYAPTTMQVSQNVQNIFGFADMQVVSFADLYGGKLAAALDRQHPRDLFDVRDLFRNEGFTDELRIAFAIYMISHSRPMAEVLGSRDKDIKQEFERGFEGMTDEPVTIEDLQAARTKLRAEAVDAMPDAHKRLLLSVERGEPDWALIDVPHAADLPAVEWRLKNIRSLTRERREQNSAELARVLSLS
jgi:predicted nucleotidyltransferase component of viral defense system